MWKSRNFPRTCMAIKVLQDRVLIPTDGGIINLLRISTRFPTNSGTRTIVEKVGTPLLQKSHWSRLITSPRSSLSRGNGGRERIIRKKAWLYMTTYRCSWKQGALEVHLHESHRSRKLKAARDMATFFYTPQLPTSTPR
ncbi:hypothetical protein Bca4012_084098 [Brassica carinata]